MRTLLTLLNREIRSYFYQPIAYVVMFFLLMVIGFNFYLGVLLLNQQPSEVTIIELAFNMVPFWIVFILTFPLITMRSFSEEYRLGTIETLTTAPVTDWQVVLSKYLGALIFYVLLWAPTLIHFAIFESITDKTAANAIGAYWGTYLLLFMMGMFFTGIGCFASSLVKEDINAAIISACTIFVWFFIPFLPEIMRTTEQSGWHEFFGYLSAAEHMREFSKGIIDSRQIVFYVSATALLLAMTLLSFQRRKWKA
ncbi:MAG TPA: ABC transporter permease subunit [Chthoniobacteraceae bacterium]|nr:ABC transporter permease subunit [Chthoniobacteraceae bacterium]